MRKKYLLQGIIFILLSLCNVSFACACSTFITTAYKTLETQISSKLQIHQNELSNLQSNLCDNISNLEKQIAEKSCKCFKKRTYCKK